MRLILFLFLSSMAMAAPSKLVHYRADDNDCPKGLAAFEKSVHPILRKDCKGCHGEGGQQAQHSIEDVKKSYAAILAYTNFDDIPKSRLVTWGGNLHCRQFGGNCVTESPEIERLVRQWWEDGEKTCPRKGKYFTRPIALPEKLPDADSGYVSMQWPLNSISTDWEGVFLEIQAQSYAKPTPQWPGTYRFRLPRLVTPKKSFRVKNLRLLVNGKYSAASNVFEWVDHTINPPLGDAKSSQRTPPLSSASLFAFQENGPTKDEISLSFEVLEVAPPLHCKDLELFKKNVFPVLEIRDCYYCHAGGPEKSIGMLSARTRMTMDLPEAELCDQLRQWTSGIEPTRSPLIDMPLRESQGHPLNFLHGSEIIPAWSEWIEKSKRTTKALRRR